jgi:hypothetical protein
MFVISEKEANREGTIENVKGTIENIPGTQSRAVPLQ